MYLSRRPRSLVTAHISGTVSRTTCINLKSRRHEIWSCCEYARESNDSKLARTIAGVSPSSRRMYLRFNISNCKDDSLEASSTKYYVYEVPNSFIRSQSRSSISAGSVNCALRSPLGNIPSRPRSLRNSWHNFIFIHHMSTDKYTSLTCNVDNPRIGWLLQ